MAAAWDQFVKKEKDVKAAEDHLKWMIESGLGIEDASEQEIERIRAWEKSGKTVMDLAYLFADMVSRRALIGVSVHHSEVKKAKLYF